MRWTLLVIVMLPFLSCKKNKNNDTIVSFSVNGRPENFSGSGGNLIHIAYSSGTIISYDFSFIQSGDGDFLNVYIPSYGSFLDSTGIGVDSLEAGTPCSVAGPYWGRPAELLTINLFPSSWWNFNIKVTRYDGQTMDGTFTGSIGGANQVDGSFVSDSVGDGIFKNLPVIRTFN